jgi:hypothetical protein
MDPSNGPALNGYSRPMRRKVTVATLLVASAVLGATAARASTLGKGAITVSVPLPAVQQSSAGTITFSVTAPAGKTVGPLRAQTVNNAKLGNLAVVYVVGTPKKASTHESVTVSVLIKRFVSRRLASQNGAPSVTLKLSPADGRPDIVFAVTKSYLGFSCDEIKFADGAFETGRVRMSADGKFWALGNGRDSTAQPSPPEEVLDNILAGIQAPAGCDFKPEGDDPGNQ